MGWESKKILVVDDSPLIRAMLSKALRERGYFSVSEAADGLEARELIENDRFDMVLSDYDMPNMNGGELLAYIKDNYPEILVVMLSGQTDKDTVVHLMRSAENYIVKDEMQHIREEIFFVIEDVFERDRLKKENKRLLRELQAKDVRMKRELETARYLLEEILPRRIPVSRVFEIKVFNRPSNVIGGDYFQITRMGDDLYTLVADIAGHGVPAALLMLTMKNAVSGVLKSGLETDRVLDELNLKLMTAFPESSYATVSGLRLNERDRSITYTNEFQNPIILVKPDGTVEELDNGKIKFLGIMIRGVNDETRPSMVSDRLQLQPGEKIFIFTDGIVEATAGDEMFGHDRVKEVLGRNASNSVEMAIRDLFAEMSRFCGRKMDDDITVIGIGLKEGGA